MRRIVYSVAVSVDGYLAGPNGEIDWIVMDPGIDFPALMTRFDTLLMGRKTFEATQALGEGMAMPGVRTCVVSRTLRQADHPELTIISEDLGAAVSALRAGAGKDVWLFGGGELFRSLLDLGLVNTVELYIIPVLLGSGIPLLPERSARASLQLLGSRSYPTTGTMMLEYAVVPQA